MKSGRNRVERDEAGEGGKRRKNLGRVLTGEDWRRSASLFFVRQIISDLIN